MGHCFIRRLGQLGCVWGERQHRGLERHFVRLEGTGGVECSGGNNFGPHSERPWLTCADFSITAQGVQWLETRRKFEGDSGRNKLVKLGAGGGGEADDFTHSRIFPVHATAQSGLRLHRDSHGGPTILRHGHAQRGHNFGSGSRDNRNRVIPGGKLLCGARGHSDLSSTHQRGDAGGAGSVREQQNRFQGEASRLDRGFFGCGYRRLYWRNHDGRNHGYRSRRSGFYGFRLLHRRGGRFKDHDGSNRIPLAQLKAHGIGKLKGFSGLLQLEGVASGICGQRNVYPLEVTRDVDGSDFSARVEQSGLDFSGAVSVVQA